MTQPPIRPAHPDAMSIETAQHVARELGLELELEPAESSSSGWSITSTHDIDACELCRQAALSAIGLARATGSVGGRHSDGQHVANVSREECGRRVDARRHGDGWLDPVCHQHAGHSGTCVGIDRAGTRSGFHYSIGGGR